MRAYYMYRARVVPSFYSRIHTKSSSKPSLYVHQGPSKSWVAEDKVSVFTNSKSIKSNLNHEKLLDSLKHLPHRLISTLLPHDYPHSVRVGYSKYVIGQMIGSVASSAGGVLSMQALLHAVGLGSGAIPMAAALNWIIKDGLGQLGGVIFAANVNTKFDSDPKKWRLLSSVALDSSCFLELMTPAAPGWFIPLAAVANVGKNVSWLSASASRAAIHNSFARSSNLADITAKTGTQSICASLAGTSLGIGISSMVGSEWGIPLVLSFAALSTTHLAVTMWSLNSVTLNTINPKRASLIVEDWLDRQTDSLKSAPSPEEVNARESVLQLHPTPEWLLYGAPVNRAVKSISELESLMDHDAHYVLSVRKRHNEQSPSHGKIAILLLLLEHSTSKDLIQGLVHANLVKRQLEVTSSHDLVTVMDMSAYRSLAHAPQDWVACEDLVKQHREESHMITQDIMEALTQAPAGWNVDVCHLDTQGIRIEQTEM